MSETALQYHDKYEGQSLLYAPSKAREYLRGQCVQGVAFYVTDNGFPTIWADAYEWLSDGLFPDQYERIPYTPGMVLQPNDVVVWLPTLPGSGGAGHIAAVISANASTFVSVDQNWGGKTIHKVTHNYGYVAGVIRFKGGRGGGGSAPAGGQEDMIGDTDNEYARWAKLGQEVRGRTLGRDEFRAAAVGRSWLQAIEILCDDAEADRTQQAQSLGQLAQQQGWQDQLATLSNTINSQNTTITDLTTKLTDASTTAQEKQKALTEALTKIASDNADLATTHDQITDLAAKVSGYETNPIIKAQNTAKAATQKPSNVAKLFASFMAAIGKYKAKK